MRKPVVALCLLILTALIAQLGFAQSMGPKARKKRIVKIVRVEREHAAEITSEFSYLTDKVYSEEPFVSKEDAMADLDQLEWLLENRYAGIGLARLDYKAALDTIRLSLQEQNSRRQLALELQKFLALLDDTGCSIEPLDTVLPEGYLAFFPTRVEGKYYAVNDERNRLVVESLPYIKSIDGIPFSKWKEAAGRLVARSGSLSRFENILTHIKHLRRELNVTNSPWIQLELADSKDKSMVLKTPLMGSPSKGKLWPRAEAGTFTKEKIGYLPVPEMTPEYEIAAELIEALETFGNTEGLILDLRNAHGYHNAVLLDLLPWFMPEEEKLRVVALGGWYEDASELLITTQGFFPKSWSKYTPETLKLIAAVESALDEENKTPGSHFGQYQYLVCQRNEKQDQQYGKPVVVLVNSRTSEAACLFLHTLKGMDKITVIGEEVYFGPGQIQIHTLENSELELSLTASRYFDVNGKTLQGTVIKPDVEHTQAFSDHIGQGDTMLERAKEILKEKMGQK